MSCVEGSVCFNTELRGGTGETLRLASEGER